MHLSSTPSWHEGVHAIAMMGAEPEHCLDCIRLIRPGETYHQGSYGTVLCPNCFSDLLLGEDFATVEATAQTAVDYGGGSLSCTVKGPPSLSNLARYRTSLIRWWRKPQV